MPTKMLWDDLVGYYAGYVLLQLIKGNFHGAVYQAMVAAAQFEAESIREQGQKKQKRKAKR